MLVCPITKGSLSLDKEYNELISKAAKLAFPIRDGIPVLLEEQARRLDDDWCRLPLSFLLVMRRRDYQGKP